MEQKDQERMDEDAKNKMQYARNWRMQIIYNNKETAKIVYSETHQRKSRENV